VDKCSFLVASVLQSCSSFHYFVGWRVLFLIGLEYRIVIVISVQLSESDSSVQLPLLCIAAVDLLLCLIMRSAYLGELEQCDFQFDLCTCW